MTDIALGEPGPASGNARLELLHRRLADRGLLARDGQPQQSGPPAGLSDGQSRMWFVHAADPSRTLLNVCVSYRITGAVDVALLRDAVGRVAGRHPVLRTTFAPDENGAPQPTVHAELAPGWAEHDLSALSASARRLRLEVLAQREFATPFDLGADAPLRITVARTGADELVMLLVAHHIAWDDGSWEVFFTDLTRAYTGAELTPLPPAAAAPSDSDADAAYWRAVMADFPEPLELPGPNGSAVPTNWRSQRTTVQLPASTATRVAELARDSGTTPYAVLLAVFGVLLHRYTHAEDFLVATPVLNRDTAAAVTIGYHGNTVAMRLRPRSAMTFGEFLAQTRDTAIGAFAHQRVSLDRVVRELNPDRRHGTERMTRVSFGFRGPDRFGFTPPGVQCERAGLRSHTTQLPLGIMIEFAADGALVELEHLVEIIDPPLARQLADHFGVLLESALTQPDEVLARLDLMGADSARWLDRMSHGPRFDTEPATLADLVERQAARTPDAVAVVYEGRHYSYRELNELANRMAHRLIAQGVGTEDRVAVLLDKSVELVVAALGVAKAGAVYLPVDPTYPPDRLTFILADCDAKLVLREAVTDLEGFSDQNPTDADRIRPLTPDNTAYLIYTSGTTGQPKGVPVAHRPIAEYFVWFKGDYHVDENDRLLQVASPSFDVSIAEVFGTLACGARIVIHKPGGLTDIGYLTDLLRDEGITAMHFVPSLLGLFLSLPGVNQWRTLQRVPIGGEPLPGEVADKFHATFDALLHNFYGPTETIINASRYKVEGKQGTRIVPIGTPKINTAMYLLDGALQPVPVGAIGEIYIGGTHVAHGYHRRPALTAERFVADPFGTGGRLYRSGDLARRNADGDIEFIGRADEQVKIRGFRIELGDVAAAISVDPSVGQAVVVVGDLPQLGKSLVGYLTPAAGAATGSVDVERIRARVAAALPEYMVPAGYVVLDEIPITTHGKIDRAKLPQPQISSRTEFREPATATEIRLAGLFTELLGCDTVGADDSFFELGGHSLVASKLVAAVRSAFGVDISVREIFEQATVARLAAHVDSAQADPDSSPARPRLVPRGGDGPAPLSSSQLRSWFGYRVEGPGPLNNIPFAALLQGPCDPDALAAAIGDVVDRHEILRTVYRDIDGVPHQIVQPPAPVAVRRSEGGDELWLQRELDAERGHVFDLERDPPLRAALLRCADGRIALSLVLHHIAGDHWSAGVLFGDVMAAYRARTAGERPGWAPLPVQYADYGAWQGQLLSDGAGVAAPQLDYWKTQLAGAPQESGLPTDHPRPRIPSGAGDVVEFGIDGDTARRLAATCRDLGATEFMALQAAVAVVLSKVGGGLDVPLGTPVAGRSETELEQLVGFFVNFVVLRNNLDGNPTVAEIIGGARDMALSAYAHQDVPFDRVVEAINPARSLARNPLFQVVVHVREALPQDRVIATGPDGDTTFTALEPPFDVAHADLSVNFYADESGYRGHLIYRRELYDRATVELLAARLTRVVAAFAGDRHRRLGDIDVFADGERRRILEEFGAGQVYLLDAALQPVPVGVAGDVYFAVPALSAGVGRLVPNPFGAVPGGQLYRTGDRARWTAAGRLEFVGAPAAPSAIDPAPGAGEPFEAPRTGTEIALAEMLAELVGRDEPIGRHDDFFGLGGDSVMAVQLAARANDAGIPLRARAVFEHPVLHELAAAVDSGPAADPEAGDAEHAPMTVSGLSDDELTAVTALWGAGR